ncbi:MAG: PAS domain S-box protein [Candidatus Krumholzibacteriota bacterium]|nr:PAS domain S-box protein [Candidatus Krumholzibacteriota bacterium]
MENDFIKRGETAYLILEKAHEGVLIAELESKRLRYSNPSLRRMLGYSEKEILRLTIDDIHPAPSRLSVRDIFRSLLQGGKKIIHSVPCLRRDGTVFFADISTFKMKISQTCCYVGFFTDISERRVTQEEIENSQRLLASVFDAVPDLLIVIDRAYKIKYTNYKGHDLIAQPEAEKGDTCYGRFKLLEEPCTDCSALPVFEKGIAVEREMVNPADNRVREVGAFPIKNAAGEVVYVVEYVRDITERKQAEAERLRLEQQVQQAQKMESLGLLAGGIAHDFNNLLQSIYGHIEIARAESMNPETNDALEASLNTIHRARSLTQQLLTFSKGGVPARKPGDIKQFLRETSQFALSGSQIICRYSFPPDLWPCDYDSNQIGQVIDNIIINSVHAAPQGGNIYISARNLKIGTGAHNYLPSGSFVKISIRDEGIGIPPEIINRIFEPFFTTKQSGSGLGLTTSYSIVKRHDGCIEVESEPGKGSIFHIILPASQRAVAEEPAPVTAAVRRGGKILIMDDDTIVKKTLQAMLEYYGFTVACASEGTEVLRMLGDGGESLASFSAIILDLTIPGGMGGKGVITEIRKRNQEIPVFVASGYADDPIISDPVASGFTDSIRKPFTREELIGMLDKHLCYAGHQPEGEPSLGAGAKGAGPGRPLNP